MPETAAASPRWEVPGDNLRITTERDQLVVAPRRPQMALAPIARAFSAPTAVAAMAAGPGGTGGALHQLGSALVVLLVLALGIAGYAASLRVHPYLRCKACKGSGRDYGAVFRRAFGNCRRCGGTGRRPRLGVVLFVQRRR